MKMNETNSADLNDFSNFHFLYFSVGNTLMLANLLKKESGNFSRGGKLEASTVIASF
jgi:hypothetical protein